MFFCQIPAKKHKNYYTTNDGDGAKRGLTLFFTLGRKRGLEAGLGLFGGRVGAKLGRSRGGRVGLDFPHGDGARHHFDGVGKMVAQRFKLDQLRPTDMNQSRRVRQGLHTAPRLGCCRSARCASGE